METDKSDAVGKDSLQDSAADEDHDIIQHTPIVGIGASAGGLETLKEMLEATPANIGACFIFVQHLDPDHKSLLTELLARYTEMPVLQAENGLDIKPDQLVIIPPDSTLTIENGVIHLDRPAPPRARRAPIDAFFHSLASDQGDSATAIVLSGTGSDGTQGARAVKEAGGFVIVQDPATAKYDSMPRNAEATGLADQVLPVSQIPARLLEHFRHLRDPGETHSPRALRDDLLKVCGILKRTTGHDFRDYKEPTLVRRVQRRMQILRISEIEDYVSRLRRDETEVRHLFRELLVSVTSFFRDAHAFEALEEKVLSPLVQSKEEGETVRIWVPGCATGEEAYSVAIALKNKVDETGKRLRVQVFATDLDEAALEVARRAVYPDSIAAYVPENYLKSYFRSIGNEYQVAEEIRELCIFSAQSVIKDPPFSRLDLVSCRNLLIYLKTELQNRLIPVLHYALRPGGHLFLGISENVSRHSKLFHSVDKTWRIFQRRESGKQPPISFPLMDASRYEAQRPDDGSLKSVRPPQNSIISVAEKAILDELGPAYVIVNANRELLYSGGRVQPFLTLPQGAPSLEILSMVHEALRMDVRAVLHRAATEGQDAVRGGLSIEVSEGRRRLSLLCRPLEEPGTGTPHFLLVFRDHGPHIEVPAGPDQYADGGQIQALESELRATKDYLQTTTEELESANEELKSANEELMSMNEELQSSNEELETSKEELQSINEELETVNAELASKVEDFARTNADLQNLFESTRIATLFLDRGLRIRRFTPAAKDLFHLIDGDVGRSITDIRARLNDIDLGVEIESVLKTLAPVEREVKLSDRDSTFMMRLHPYRTPDEVIDGVVATFVDVTRLDQAHQRIDQLNQELRQNIVDLEALLDLAPIGIAFADDPSCEWIQVNRYGAQIMRVPHRTPPAGGPSSDYKFVHNGVEVPPADLPLQKAWRTGKPVTDFRATYIPADGQAFEFLMSAAPVKDAEGRIRRVIGVYDDVSRLVEAQTAAHKRASQQDYVATRGTKSLRGSSGEDLVDSISEQVANMLDIPLVKILENRPHQQDLELRAAHGFDVPLGSSVPAGLDSQAGYTMQSGSPVIVENLAAEARFSGPQLLIDAGVVSGVSILIGDPETPWGVLGAHTKVFRTFTADEVKFLQSVANVIAATVQRDEWERHQRLLLDELRHRVKNSLASVQAIAALSFRSAAEPETTQGFLSRLQALAQSHDLNFESDWRGVPVSAIIRQQLAAFDTDGSRVSCAGTPDLSLPPNAAIDIGIIIHELATNAAKYGALSTRQGRVSVTWTVETQSGARYLEIDWEESGGPAVTPASAGKDGVGSRLFKAFSRRKTVNIERSLNEQGVSCRIEYGLAQS